MQTISTLLNLPVGPHTVAVCAVVLLCLCACLQHYCDEVDQGIRQATDDARKLHDSVTRLAAQCTPQDLLPALAVAGAAPAGAAQGAALPAAAAPGKLPASNVVAYGDHSSGNIYGQHNGTQQRQQLARPAQN
jgi:hypothetical protein